MTTITVLAMTTAMNSKKCCPVIAKNHSKSFGAAFIVAMSGNEKVLTHHIGVHD